MVIERKGIKTKVLDPHSLEMKETVYEGQVINQYHQIVELPIASTDKAPSFAPCLPLTKGEEKYCKLQARKDTEKEFGGRVPKLDDADISVWNDAFEDNYVAWVLFKSFRLPDDFTKPLFISKDQVLNDLGQSAQALAIMYGQYAITLNNQPALLKAATIEQSENGYSKLMDAIIQEATVEGTSFLVNGLTTQASIRFLRYLVAENLRLQTVNGPATGLSNDTTTTSNTQTQEKND